MGCTACIEPQCLYRVNFTLFYHSVWNSSGVHSASYLVDMGLFSMKYGQCGTGIGFSLCASVFPCQCYSVSAMFAVATECYLMKHALFKK